MAYTADQYRAAAKKAMAAGDTAAAKRLIEAGRKAEAAPQAEAQTLDQRIAGGIKSVRDGLEGVQNKVMEGMTFGLAGDEFRARLGAIGPKTYDQALEEERAKEATFADKNPALSIGSEIGGAILSPIGVLGAGKAALPAVTGGTGAVAKALGLTERMGKSAASTAAQAGLYGFMEGEGAEDRIENASGAAKVGAGIGAAIPVVGAGVQKVADAVVKGKAIRAAAANAPTTAARRAEGEALYDAIDAAGVQIKPQAFDRLRAQTDAALQGTGFDPLPGPGGLTPKAARVMQTGDEMAAEMAANPTAALPFKSLDQMRRRAGASAGDMSNKVESAAGSEIIGQVDDFVKGLQPGDVVAGDVKALQTLLPKAREVWSQMSKSQMIDDAIANSDNYLSGGASGIRNQFKNILNNPKKARGFTEAEKQVMRRVAQGTLPEQLLYLVSGGLGNLATIGGGAIAGGPVGAIAGAGVSAALRAGAGKVAGRNAELARAIMANGGLNTLPVASPQARTIAETLMRRGTAATSR